MNTIIYLFVKRVLPDLTYSHFESKSIHKCAVWCSHEATAQILNKSISMNRSIFFTYYSTGTEDSSLLVCRGELKVVVDYGDNSWITAGLYLDYITSNVIIPTMKRDYKAFDMCRLILLCNLSGSCCILCHPIFLLPHF